MNRRIRVYFAILLLLIGVSVFFSNFSNLILVPNQESEVEELPTKVSMPIPPEKKEFLGIDVTNLDVTEAKLEWGQSLSILLNDYRYDGNHLVTLAKKSKKIFDLRKMTSGKKISIIHTSDSIKQVKHVIYEPNLETYVVYSFDDSTNIRKIKKPIEIKQRTMAGIIEFSLYETMLDLGGSALLVDEFVDVLAWQIDFFGIQKYDKFKVVYTERYVNGESTGVEEIISAFFESSGKPFYAFKYCQGEGEKDYFDDDGNSVRKAFLRAPLQYSRISSRYNPRRFHPVQKRFKAHLGTDYAAPVGTPIRTVGDGVVIKSTFSRNNGNYVKIKHNATYSTQYLHMSRRAKGMRKGVRVKKGEIIGYVGSTGLATGPHLCYRFWKNGVQVDALKVKLPPSQPIHDKYIEDFISLKQELKREIDEISYPEDQDETDYIVQIEENKTNHGHSPMNAPMSTTKLSLFD